MKKIILMVTLIIAGLTVRAQDNEQGQAAAEEVPQEVSSSFEEEFSDMDINMDDVTWEDDQGYHVAEFSDQDKEFTARFDEEGKLITTEVKNFPLSEVPDNVKEGFEATNYSDWNVKDVEKIESEDLTLYKMELRSGIKGTDLYLNEDGKIVRIDS